MKIEHASLDDREGAVIVWSSGAGHPGRSLVWGRVQRPNASIGEHRVIMDGVLSRDAVLAVSVLNKAIELLTDGSSKR